MKPSKHELIAQLNLMWAESDSDEEKEAIEDYKREMNTKEEENDR